MDGNLDAYAEHNNAVQSDLRNREEAARQRLEDSSKHPGKDGNLALSFWPLEMPDEPPSPAKEGAEGEGGGARTADYCSLKR